jgi:hypothetical protein
MTFQQQDLEHLRIGWQKVVDQRRYGTTIYVFEYHGQYTAVMNPNQGVGTLVEKIHARTPDTDKPALRDHGTSAEPHDFATPTGDGVKL